MFETTLYNKIPPVSSRATLLLAGVGLLCLMAGLYGGALLLAPAGVSAFLGVVTGCSHLFRVQRGHAYPREGKTTLVAALFINASLSLFILMAGYILLRFGA